MCTCVFLVNKRVRYTATLVLILIYVRAVGHCVIIFIDVRQFMFIIIIVKVVPKTCVFSDI